jgi:hypothetical protein
MQLLTPASQEQTALLMHCMCLQKFKLHWTGLQPYRLLLVGVRSSPMLLGQRKLPSRLWVFRVFWVSLTRQHGGVTAAGQHSVLTERIPEARACPWQEDGVQAASLHPRRSYPFRAVVAPSADSLMRVVSSQWRW